MRHLVFAGFTGLMLVSTGSLAAEKLGDCRRLYDKDPDTVIGACSPLINSGKLSRDDLSSAYYIRGRAFQKKNELESAISDFSHAIQLDPKSGALSSRASAYEAQGKLKEAINDLTLGINRAPPDIPDLPDILNRGHLLFLSRDYAASIADLDRAISISEARTKPFAYESPWPEARGFRGLVYAVTGKYEQAISEFNEVISRNSYPAWIISRATIYRLNRQYDKADADFNELIRRFPQAWYFYMLRALNNFDAGKPDVAIADLDKSANLAPVSALHPVLWGYILRSRSGSRDTSAIAEIATKPNQKDIDLAVYRLFLGQSTPAELISIANIVANPVDRQNLVCNVRGYIGEWYLLNGQGSEARQHFKYVTDNCGPTHFETMFPAALSELRRLEIEADHPSSPSSPQGPAASLKVPTPSKPLEAVVSLGQSAVPDPGRRIALVIGNSKYQNVPPLTNPTHDAEMVAEVLKRVGFEDVTLLEDLNKAAMVDVLRNFATKANKADWAVVYYAGHGMEIGGINYLIPVDARLATDRDINFEAVPLDQILNAAERASKLRLVILDACRDNPFKNQMKRTLAVTASRGVTIGLAPIEPDPGTLVVYAAKGGEMASDGDGDHGPFAIAFVKDVLTPGLEVRRLFDFVRDDVLEMTHREQQPFSYGSISGRQDFYFVPPATKSDN
jgi:tetratricopeptide (TPR) repeat protein